MVWKDYSPSHFSGGTGTFNGIDESLKEVPSRVKCEPASVGEFWCARPLTLWDARVSMWAPPGGSGHGVTCALSLHSCMPQACFPHAMRPVAVLAQTLHRRHDCLTRNMQAVCRLQGITW